MASESAATPREGLGLVTSEGSSLRRALAADYEAHQSNVGSGYGRTALALLRDPRHFAPRDAVGGTTNQQQSRLQP